MPRDGPPSALLKELQRCAALACHADVYQKEDQMSAHDLYSMYYKKFHGDPDNDDDEGYIVQVLEGASPFSPLWEYDAGATGLHLNTTYFRGSSIT